MMVLGWTPSQSHFIEGRSVEIGFNIDKNLSGYCGAYQFGGETSRLDDLETRQFEDIRTSPHISHASVGHA
jgi:hypothetical protein